jgi:hypothetical protein
MSFEELNRLLGLTVETRAARAALFGPGHLRCCDARAEADALFSEEECYAVETSPALDPLR